MKIHEDTMVSFRRLTSGTTGCFSSLQREEQIQPHVTYSWTSEMKHMESEDSLRLTLWFASCFGSQMFFHHSTPKNTYSNISNDDVFQYYFGIVLWCYMCQIVCCYIASWENKKLNIISVCESFLFLFWALLFVYSTAPDPGEGKTKGWCLSMSSRMQRTCLLIWIVAFNWIHINKHAVNKMRLY